MSLDVGGTHKIRTSQDVLCKVNGSLLQRMCWAHMRRETKQKLPTIPYPKGVQIPSGFATMGWICECAPLYDTYLYDPSAKPQTGFELKGPRWEHANLRLRSFFGRRTGPRRSEEANGFIWVDSRGLATILDTFYRHRTRQCHN